MLAHVGSQNIAEPKFVPGYPNEELVARVTGPIVAHLQTIYLADRYLETDQVIDETDLFPAPTEHGNSVLQILPSGPGHGRENAQLLMVDLIYDARKRVVITTPYFVPDEPFLQAMCAAVPRRARKCIWSSPNIVQPTPSPASPSNRISKRCSTPAYKSICISRISSTRNISASMKSRWSGRATSTSALFALNAEISLIVYDPTAIAARARSRIAISKTADC